MRLSAIMEMVASTDLAVATLIHLAKNASSEAISLKASTELLDRSGVRGGVDLFVDHQVTDTRAVDVLTERLNKLQGAAERRDQSAAAAEEAELLPPPASALEPVEGEIMPDGYLGRIRRINPVDPPD